LAVTPCAINACDEVLSITATQRAACLITLPGTISQAFAMLYSLT
jgi:hypothetical protein